MAPHPFAVNSQRPSAFDHDPVRARVQGHQTLRAHLPFRSQSTRDFPRGPWRRPGSRAARTSADVSGSPLIPAALVSTPGHCGSRFGFAGDIGRAVVLTAIGGGVLVETLTEALSLGSRLAPAPLRLAWVCVIAIALILGIRRIALQRPLAVGMVRRSCSALDVAVFAGTVVAVVATGTLAPVAVPAGGAAVGGAELSKLGSGKYGKTPVCPWTALSMMILLLFLRISSIVSR